MMTAEVARRGVTVHPKPDFRPSAHGTGNCTPQDRKPTAGPKTGGHSPGGGSRGGWSSKRGAGRQAPVLEPEPGSAHKRGLASPGSRYRERHAGCWLNERRACTAAGHSRTEGHIMTTGLALNDGDNLLLPRSGCLSTRVRTRQGLRSVAALIIGVILLDTVPAGADPVEISLKLAGTLDDGSSIRLEVEHRGLQLEPHFLYFSQTRDQSPTGDHRELIYQLDTKAPPISFGHDENSLRSHTVYRFRSGEYTAALTWRERPIPAATLQLHGGPPRPVTIRSAPRPIGTLLCGIALRHFHVRVYQEEDGGSRQEWLTVSSRGGLNRFRYRVVRHVVARPTSGPVRVIEEIEAGASPAAIRIRVTDDDITPMAEVDLGQGAIPLLLAELHAPAETPPPRR